jgi:hypothetical protein
VAQPHLKPAGNRSREAFDIWASAIRGREALAKVVAAVAAIVRANWRRERVFISRTV